MKGLDTDALLSWLLDEESDLFTAHDTYRVNFAVIAELVWVLDRSFRRSRKEIVEVISKLLAASELLLQKHEIVAAALDDYRHGRADFADYLIALDNLEAGCETTLTFDRKAARHPAFKLIR